MDRQIDRQIDKQTDRQTDRQTDKQTDRQTDRLVEIYATDPQFYYLLSDILLNVKARCF